MSKVDQNNDEVTRLRARAEKAEANYAFMVKRAVEGADGRPGLDAYRELGARAAAAENEADRLQGEARVANALHRELNDLFGWGDESMLHALAHVRNAVINLRADLRTEKFLRENAEKRQHYELDGCVTAIESLRAERNILRERLREVAQVLVAEIGADGPMDAEDAARKAVGRMERLRELADEKAHEAGLHARRMEEAQRERDEARNIIRNLMIGQASERRAVVAYLRERANARHPTERGVPSLSPAGRGLINLMADRIERGEHIVSEEE